MIGDDNCLAEDAAGPDEGWPDVCPHTDAILVTGVVSHMGYQDGTGAPHTPDCSLDTG